MKWDNKQIDMKKAMIFMVILVIGDLAVRSCDLVRYNNEQSNKMFSDISNYYKSTDFTPGQPIKPIDTKVKATGIYGKMEKHIKEIFNETAKINNEYQQQFVDIGWQDILSFNRLKNDLSLTESKNIIRKAKELNTFYRYKMANVFKTAKITARNQLDPILYKGAVKGLNKAEMRANLGFSNDLVIIEKADNIINFLDKKKGQWKIGNDQLLFYTDADVEQHKQLSNEFIQAIEKQEQFQKQYIENARKQLKEMQ